MTPGMPENTRYSEVGDDCVCMDMRTLEGRDPSCPIHGSGKPTLFSPKHRIGPPCTCGAEAMAIFEGHGPECIFEVARLKAAEMVDDGEITQEQARQRLINWEHHHPEFESVIKAKWGGDINPDMFKEEVIVAVDPAKGEDQSAIVVAEVNRDTFNVVQSVTATNVDIWVWRNLIPDVEGGPGMVPQFASISLTREQVNLMNSQAPIPPGYHPGNWSIYDPDGGLDLEKTEPD